jgi:hypothetical protein
VLRITGECVWGDRLANGAFLTAKVESRRHVLD